MSLQNLQAEFADAIFSEETVIETISFPERLSIYRNNFYSTLLHTLMDTYPLVKKLVGDDFFIMTAKEYMRQYPSRSSNLQDYGEYFSDFLIEYPPVKNLVYLSDVAVFEWACHAIYSAPDHAGFDIHSLETMSAEQYDLLHFALHPASRLLHSHYPLLKIIDLCRGAKMDEIDIRHGGIYLLIFRREFDASFMPLTEGEFTFLSTIHEGYSLNDALNETFAIDPHFQLNQKLPEWIQQKIIVDCC